MPHRWIARFRMLEAVHQSHALTVRQCDQKELPIFQADYLIYFETYYHGVLCEMLSNSHRSFGPWLLHVCDHVHLTVSVAITLYVQRSQYNSVCSSPVMWNKAPSYKGTYLRRSSFSWISHNMKYVFQFTFPALISFCKQVISATYTAHSRDIRL